MELIKYVSARLIEPPALVSVPAHVPTVAQQDRRKCRSNTELQKVTIANVTVL